MITSQAKCHALICSCVLANRSLLLGLPKQSTQSKRTPIRGDPKHSGRTNQKYRKYLSKRKSPLLHANTLFCTGSFLLSAEFLVVPLLFLSSSVDRLLCCLFCECFYQAMFFFSFSLVVQTTRDDAPSLFHELGTSVKCRDFCDLCDHRPSDLRSSVDRRLDCGARGCGYEPWLNRLPRSIKMVKSRSL